MPVLRERQDKSLTKAVLVFLSLRDLTTVVVGVEVEVTASTVGCLPLHSVLRFMGDEREGV